MVVVMKSNTIIWLLPEERVCQTLTCIVDVQLRYVLFSCKLRPKDFKNETNK